MVPLSWPLQASSPQDMRWLRVEDASAVAACRKAVQIMAERLRFPAARIGQLALAVTEAASNLHKHAEQGSLLLCVNRDGPQPGIDLVTIDAGPGVRDVTAVLRDGHSTAGTLGIGLGAIQRLADFADLYSRPGHGTSLVARFRAVLAGGATPPDPPEIGGAARPPKPPWPRWAGLIRPITGETECGDAYGVVLADDTVTAVLCDGLGHGPLAAAAAAAGVAAVLDDPAGEPAVLLERVHRRMSGTRGGAVGVVQVGGQLARFAGLGNVAASIVSDGQRRSMISIPGIAGLQARTIRQFEYDVPPGSAVIMHSDGVSSRWEAAALPALLLLNAELQETNRGVMALYGELSDELEQTNRGVVALYAELDEKSERLRAASESKDRFWANVSHELRTPLNSIIGLTRLLAEPAPDGTVLDAERLYQTELIRNSGTTLLTLVNDLLDVAKAESGQLHVDPAQVNLPALFGRLRGLARPMAEGKPVEVIVSADGDPNTPVTILTDEVALTSILRNLLSNGIKYIDHGEVRLSVRVAGPRLEISVADTGIGIPAGLHEHVFEEFYQVPGRRRGGTGLGLPYARRLTAILGGDLTLTSEPDAGTTVVLGLPLRTPSVGTVLLADDDAAFRGVLKGLLDGLADRVLEAGDGREALALLAQEPVDLMLADMRMPGMDGSALLARLPASVPAIIVTGADVPPPPRAAAMLRKDELTRERLEFTLRGIIRSPS